MPKKHSHYYVYIFGDQPGSDLQIGIVNDLLQHVAEIKRQEGNSGSMPISSKLVYYEHYDEEVVAKNREQQIKRSDKYSTNSLVSSMNPNWMDLSDTL